MKNKRNFKSTKVERDGMDVFDITTCGERILVAVREDKVDGINWNGTIYDSDELKTDKFVNILAWLIPCRENRHVVKTMNNFIITKN